MQEEINLLFYPVLLFGIGVISLYFYFFWNVGEKKNIEEEVERKSNQQALRELFEKGKEYEEAKDYKNALDHYLGYLYGFDQLYKDSNTFPETLVHCLQRVTSICRASGKPELALQFLQAEKFLYENMLVTDENELKIKKGDLKDAAIRRATKLEKLSDIMLKEGKTELAVSYASKALQLRQKHASDQGAVSMQQFMKAYAELGRETYKKNLDWYKEIQEKTEEYEKVVQQKLEEELEEEEDGEFVSVLRNLDE